MELNLHIIVDDLEQYAPNSRILEDYQFRRLRFPALFDGTETKPEMLYITEAALLTADNIGAICANSSLLVIGRPPKALFDSSCNFLWVAAGVQLSKLFTDVANIFAKYNFWAEQLQQLLIKKKRLSRLAEVSWSVVSRPIHLVDSFLQILFSVSGDDAIGRGETRGEARVETKGEARGDAKVEARGVARGAAKDEAKDVARQQLLQISNNDPAFGVLTLDRFNDGAFARKEPFLLGPGELLSQNIFIAGHLVATLSFSKVDKPFTKKDYVLLEILSETLRNGLTYMEEWNTSAPKAVDTMLQRLLAGEVVQEANINTALKTMAWHEDDSYYCIVAVPTNPLYPTGLLTATAKRAAAQIKQMIYTVQQGTMAFIINADQSTLAQEEVLALLVSQLEPLETGIGVSNIFDGFHHLKSHFELAIAAQSLGLAADAINGENNAYHRFESYLMDFIVQKCRETVAIDAIIPRGLVQLSRYDKKYGTNLVKILAVYLRHDMRVAPAARELYLHRNTLTSKIAQIRFLTRMDFENDSEIRLSLMVSLRMMGML